MYPSLLPCLVDNPRNIKSVISTIYTPESFINNHNRETGLQVSCFIVLRPALYAYNERGQQPATPHSRPNSDMQMSTRNICTSPTRTADAQLFLRGLFRGSYFTVKPSTSGIANLTHRGATKFVRDSPDGRHFVYTYRKGRREGNSNTWKAVIYKQYICFNATYPSCHIMFCRRITVC